MSHGPVSPGDRYWQAIRCEKRIQKRLAELDEQATDIADIFQAMADTTQGDSRCHVNKGEGTRRTNAHGKEDRSPSDRHCADGL